MDEDQPGGYWVCPYTILDPKTHIFVQSQSQSREMELQRFLVSVTCLVAVLGSVSGGPSAERRYKGDPKSRFLIVKRNTGDSGDIPSGEQRI